MKRPEGSRCILRGFHRICTHSAVQLQSQAETPAHPGSSSQFGDLVRSLPEGEDRAKPCSSITVFRTKQRLDLQVRSLASVVVRPDLQIVEPWRPQILRRQTRLARMIVHEGSQVKANGPFFRAHHDMQVEGLTVDAGSAMLSLPTLHHWLCCVVPTKYWRSEHAQQEKRVCGA